MNKTVIRQEPDLSAIVVIPDTYETVKRTVEALKKQTVAAQIELVFVVPADARIEIPPGLDTHFAGIQIEEIAELVLAPALARGVRHARAPVVAFTEDHAFPAPNWAECLIAAHQGLFAAVGPAMRNANSWSLVACADFYLGYGKWAEPIDSGPVDFLMEHNCSYKRDVLVEYGERLGEVLESETAMQFEMATRGHAFWLEASTYTAHLSFAHWGPWLKCMVWHGRIFAAHRAAAWPKGKRILYTVTAPLIPLVRLQRIRGQVGRARLALGARLRLLSVIMIGLVAEAAGQAVGYSMGEGGTVALSLEYEFHRERYLDAIPTAPAE